MIVDWIKPSSTTFNSTVSNHQSTRFPAQFCYLSPAMPDFSIGVDLGGTNLRIAAVIHRRAAARKSGPRHQNRTSSQSRNRGNVFRDPADLAPVSAGSGKFLGAGIGIPGIIDLETGMIRKSANLPGFAEYPVREEIERRLPRARVVLDNDGNFAALGEKWLGAARSVPNMAVVTLGTGIGGGIVLGGKICHGMTGMSGEFGHVTVEPEGRHAAAATTAVPSITPPQAQSCGWSKEAIATGVGRDRQGRGIQSPNSARSRFTTWRCAATMPSRRSSATSDASGHYARRDRQHLEPRDVCHWRRSSQRLGCLRAQDV